MWFESLMGFREQSPQQVRQNISVDGTKLTSHVNGKTFTCGTLETPTLEELRNQVHLSKIPTGTLSIHEVVDNVQLLHRNRVNTNALFQVASQFNLLEMTSPQITPEMGVDRYEYDLTQGPACAIAAGAGTIYRNYFTEINGQLGQSKNNQIDCLSEIGRALGNTDKQIWEMTNGYALITKKGLLEISKQIENSNPEELDHLRQQLRVGVQWNTQVTLPGSSHTVSQIYCSALPVAYSPHSYQLWSAFAQLILEATYEATICAGILNALKTGNNKIYLTLIGGGAFGNIIEWIINAIERSCVIYKHIDLEIIIVSRSRSNKHVQELITKFNLHV